MIKKSFTTQSLSSFQENALGNSIYCPSKASSMFCCKLAFLLFMLMELCCSSANAADTRSNLITSNTAGATVTFSTSNTYEWEWEWDSNNGRLKSKKLPDDKLSSITEISITTTQKTKLSFDWKVSSEENCDYLIVQLDGTTIVRKSGRYQGQVSSIVLGEIGTHKLKLIYSIDADDSDNDDAAYISNVSLTPASGSLNVISSNTAGANVSFSSTGSYEWAWDSTKSRLASTNKGKANSTSQTTITINTPTESTLVFDYGVSSESNYDKLTITLDGTTIANAISGVSNKSCSQILSSGSHTLVLKYSKDSSTNGNEDIAYISNVRIYKPIEYVDLGLPTGTQWASMNVGANTEYDYGNYYAWGETTTKQTYTTKNYKYASGLANEGNWTSTNITKYTTANSTLANSDDAAYTNMGTGWVIPSVFQAQELIRECTWTQEGSMVRVTGPNGNSILLPLPGYRYDGNPSVNPVGNARNTGERAYIWLNSTASSAANASMLNVSTGSKLTITADGSFDRYYGQSVRAVSTTKASRVLASTLHISSTNSTVAKGNKLSLQVTILPSNATTKSVLWSSSNTSVATVDKDGVVTGVNAGTVTITATAKDGSGKTDTYEITVANLVTNITLNKTSLTLLPGATSTLTVTYTPTDATNRSVTWSSSNTSVATVSGGVVTAKGAGTATITAKTTNGKTATCSVHVHNLSAYAAMAATCTTQGTNAYWYCSSCNKLFSDANATTETNAAALTIAKKGHGHTNGYTPTYTWGGTATSPTCTFTLTCKDCNTVVVNAQTLTKTLGIYGSYYTQIASTAATCTATGSRKYRAYGKYSVTGNKEYSGTNDKTYTIAALGHSYKYTDMGDGTHKKECTRNDLTATYEKHTYESGRCTLCSCSTYILEDASTSFANASDVTFSQLTYTRNFGTTNYQCLYVPISINIADIAKDFDVYKIGALYLFDADGDGNYFGENDPDASLRIFKVESGVLKPNHPYYIKAKSTGAKTIPSYDNILYQTKENHIECSTMETTCTFYGNNTKKAIGKDYFTVSGGKLEKIKGTVALGAFRWYMLLTDRDGQIMQIPSNVKILLMTDDEEDETDGINVHKTDVQSIYSVNGMKQDALTKGVNIIRYSDGSIKKVLVK